MIKFTDVCKAYIRYWYVIIVCMVLCLGAVMGVTYGDKTYTAKSTMLVEKNASVPANEFISQAYAESVIKEMGMMINHTRFTEKVIEKVAETDEALASKLDTNKLNEAIKVNIRKDATFFEISLVNTNKDNAKTIVDAVSDVAINEYGAKEGTKAKITKVYNTEVFESKSKTVVYAVIGLLIGIVLGVVVVTFFVVFNNRVENSELIEKESGLPVLAVLDKQRGDK